MQSALIVIWAVFLLPTHCSKVLLIPMDHPGHVNFLILGGQALTHQGHEVHVFAPIKHRQKIVDAGLVPISWKPKKAISPHDDPEILELLSQSIDDGKGVSIKNFYKLSNLVPQKIKLQCEEFLSNTQLMQHIDTEKFDMALVDSMPFAKCLYILPWMHSIRYISISTGLEPWAARVPSFPSVEPIILLAQSNEMSFFQRLKNFLVAVMIPYLVGLKYDDTMLARYAGNRSERSFLEITSRSEMFLINNEILLLDYPRVSAPHYVFLGGMGGKPPKPLQPDLELFASSAETLVVVSFGSLIKLPEHLVRKFLFVFSELATYHFIMRLTAVPESLPRNVKIMKWLPQNDLLGYPKTKLFITHGGSNGQLESLYHGIPMIVVPMFSDAFYNAVRAKTRKYGKILSPAADTKKIVSTIREVLEDDTYRNSIHRASKIYRSLPQANETLAFWVDHVIKYGSDHIRPPYMDMPLYKFFMLDLLVFFMAVAVAGISSCFLCCKLALAKYHGEKKHIKKE